MAFNLIGLGLNLNSLTLEAVELIKSSDKVYLENYTVDFPYKTEELEKEIGHKVILLPREKVESEEILKDAKNKEVSLLVYGDSLSATTHIQLISECKKQKIKFRIIHNASILTAVAETGLQLYKFGKTASMPKFQKNFEPDSFLDIVDENQKIKAHTLLLTDIGLNLGDALKQLRERAEKRKIKIEKIIVCSQLGTENSKIYFDSFERLIKLKCEMPFCIVIPSKLHFLEEEALNILKER